MQKKYFLLAALVACFVSDAQAPDVSYGVGTNVAGIQLSFFRNGQIKGEVIAAAVGLIFASKIAYDLSWHNAYEVQTSKYYQDLKKHIHVNDIKHVDDATFLNFSTQATREDVLFLETSISNSYDSWLCPWNWTESQKNAYQHIQVVSILTLYADLLRAGNQLNEQIMAQYCRDTFVFTTMYPYVTCHIKINNHLDFIKSFVSSHEDEKLRVMLQDMAIHLERFNRILQGQKEYIDELQIMKTHALLQESINAQRHCRRY